MTTHSINPADTVEMWVEPGAEAAFTVHISAAPCPVVPPVVLPPVPPLPPLPTVPWVDLTATFPTNPTAQNPYQSPGRWATRVPTAGITVHHTGSNDAYALARVCLAKGYTVNGVWRAGLPTTQYSIFIQTDGVALLCVPLNQAGWHDHAGYPNSNISIGLAGYWHRTRPPAALITGLARVVAYLLNEYNIPLARVVGHRDRALPNGVSTECPGWYAAPLGAGWKPDFDAALAAARG